MQAVCQGDNHEISKLLPLLTAIINKSMIEPVMTESSVEDATIMSLLKRSGLENEDTKNYRPLRNIPSISKLTRKALTRRTAMHMQNNDCTTLPSLLIEEIIRQKVLC